MMLPFGLLLACMAVLPLRWPNWWEKHYAKLVLCFAAITIGYYFFVLPPAALKTVTHPAQDYAGFITLIGTLYIVSGGIHLRAGGIGAAGGSTLFLALGGLAANLLGATGASMLLIRPWLRMNRSRIAPNLMVKSIVDHQKFSLLPFSHTCLNGPCQSCCPCSYYYG
jgi:Na+/H+ antiporter NhaD/arsenite permease-like protein